MPWLGEPASTRRTSLGQATGGRALRLIRLTVATLWCARRENQNLPMSADPAFLGNPARHNPEDLLVAAISSCHMLWYLHLCAEAGIIVRAYEDRPSGRLIESSGERGTFRVCPFAAKGDG